MKYSDLFTYEQKQQLANLLTQAGLNDHVWPSYGHYNLVSYTLREHLNTIRTHDAFNNTLTIAALNILGSLIPDFTTEFRKLIAVQDRRATETQDPLTQDAIAQIAYIPKGITLFQKENSTLDTDLTAHIQRELIKLLEKNETVPASHKAVTIKAFKKDNQIYIYFNKTHPVIIDYLLKHCTTYILSILPHNIEASLFLTLAYTLSTTVHEQSDEALLDRYTVITEYLQKIVTHKQENFLEEFAKTYNEKLNANRLEVIKRDIQNAERNISTYQRELTQALHNLSQAKQAESDYSPLNYIAITELLHKLKERPTLQHMALHPSNSNQLVFILDEPILFTDENTWDKYLKNADSFLYTDTLRYMINDSNYKWNTNFTSFQLKLIMKRVIRDIFIDKNTTLTVRTTLSLYNNNNNFQISTGVRLDGISDKGIPHPHINSLNCWGDSMSAITKAIYTNNAEIAYTQLIYALQQLTATDITVVRRLAANMFTNTHTCNIPIYTRDDKKLTLLELIDILLKKEIDDNETNSND